MLRIAFIDHSYHKKTRSSEFFLNILRVLGTVDIYWDDSWNTQTPLDFRPVDSGNYDILVFWQILYSAEIIKQRQCRRILLVPMYDSVGDVSPSFWLSYRKCYFLNFSMALHSSVSECGIPSFYLQYFPDPSDFRVANTVGDLRVFFWERNKDVTINTVKNWFSACGDCLFHYHHAPDPGNESTFAGLDNDRRWTESSWFATSAEYREVLSSCSAFIAPRKFEGIGMAFLEAMAIGLAVIGLPYPTLNEYVIHNQNGLLVDVDGGIDFAGIDWRALGAAARKTVEDGYQCYKVRIPELEQWIKSIVSGRVHFSRPVVCLALVKLFSRAVLGKTKSIIRLMIRLIFRKVR